MEPDDIILNDSHWKITLKIHTHYSDEQLGDFIRQNNKKNWLSLKEIKKPKM